MSADAHGTKTHTPIQIGVILCADIAETAVPTLKFLILQLNTLQTAFEYQCLPNTDDPLLVKLASGQVLNRSEITSDYPRFRHAYLNYIETEISDYHLTCSKPAALIAVSRACFDDEYYMTGRDNISVLALGHWERIMAPPSLAEFILTMVLSCSIYSLPHAMRMSHYGTKGCLFDFNADLSNARFMALQGFICSECREKLHSAGYGKLAEDLAVILEKKWLGRTTNPNSPAGIASKLGYNLFATKGLTQRWSELLSSKLKDEGVKEVIRIFGEILIVVLLIRMGLKHDEKPGPAPQVIVLPQLPPAPGSSVQLAWPASTPHR